jgi:hypothetical protein
MEKQESLKVLNKCLEEIQNMSQEEFDKRISEAQLEIDKEDSFVMTEDDFKILGFDK